MSDEKAAPGRPAPGHPARGCPGAAAGPTGQPPAGLLEDLLEQASHPGMKGRAAVPVRGAVTGARPLLSLVLLLVGAAGGGGIGYACWRATQWLRTRAQATAASQDPPSRRLAASSHRLLKIFRTSAVPGY